MNTTVLFEIANFPVPETVAVIDSVARKNAKLPPTGDIMLKDLDDKTLEKLCTKFVKDVWVKAGRTLSPDVAIVSVVV